MYAFPCRGGSYIYTDYGVSLLKVSLVFVASWGDLVGILVATSPP